MQSEERVPAEPSAQPPAEQPAEQLGEHGADVSVLAAVSVDRRRSMRLGARVFPLRRWMARRHGLVGAEVAVTASLLDQLPTGPTVVVVVAPEVDLDGVLDQLLPAAHGMLGPGGDPLTLGVASPTPVRSGSAGTLVMYNQHPDALPEALVEAVAASRRCGLTTAVGNTVLLLQRFVPAPATAVVHASPHRWLPVRVDGRWGLTEVDSPADCFEVPADGSAVLERLAHKPTARVPARGGTHTVHLPTGWRERRSLGRATVRELAAVSRAAAVAVRRPLSLDVALAEQGPVVLRCRPATG